MNIFRKAIGYLVTSLSLTNTAGWKPEGSGTAAGESVTQDNVLGLSAAWACVNLIAGTIASLPFEVYRPDKGGKHDVVDHSHWLYRLLHDSPNADQTALDFWEFICASIELRGNGYARIERLGGRIVSLVPVNPSIICVRRDNDGALVYTWVDRGVSYKRKQEDMLHVRGFGGSPEGGLSTLAFGREVFGLSIAIDKASAATFKNGLRPAGVLKFDKWLDAEKRDITKQTLHDAHTGALNAGKPLLLEGGLSWEQLKISPEDAQMLQSRGFSIEEICRYFGVPPIMVGHGEKTSSWGTGVAEVTQGFVKYTLRRRLKRIEQAVAKQLLTDQDRGAGVTVKFNLDALLRGDPAARSKFYQVMTQIGAMTINEVRALEGLAPIDGGDVARMQTQNQPISDTPGIGDNGGPPLGEGE